MLWARLALASTCCRVLPTRYRCPNLVCLYAESVGGYHSDLPRSWRILERTVASGAPGIRWDRLDRFAMLFDDQINFPAERCRASLGYVLAAGEDLQAVAAAWGRHPLVAHFGLRVAVFPAGDCLAADMPSCGTLIYLVCLVRALHSLRTHIKATGITTKVPGLLEVHSPLFCRVTFLLPLEARQELLPF